MSKTKTLLGFVAGAAVGVLAGILLAPEKGSETRKMITDKTGELADSLKNSFADFIDQVKHSYAKAEGTADELENKARAKINTIKADVKTSMDNSLS